ncbi:hypothetical protein [Dyadobacter luticola]|uniref:HMA domain-containing protein n=1 Tax=Dyadobacter luticola TaxID=1979387 RepID=A0A5R9L438_9BACT|nr:hypothetical protein [Dyadobacter luticola]TLV03171.1 hypothetical protein FEN17_06030 [Dyadobacter luticola]
MVEIFKTNVEKPNQARILINLIQLTFNGYAATFDLEDCDKVLRIKSADCEICAKSVIRVIRQSGFQAEILEDENQTTTLYSTKLSSLFQ